MITRIFRSIIDGVENENKSGSASNPAVINSTPRICHNAFCSFETIEAIRRCPKCKRPVLTALEFRLLSLVLIPCGLFFVALGAGLIYIIANPFSDPDIPKLKGGSAVAILLYGFFGLFLVFGFAVVMAGLWQFITGKPGKRLVTVIVALLMTFLFVIIAAKSLSIFGF